MDTPKQIRVELNASDLTHTRRFESSSYKQRICIYDAFAQKQIITAADRLDLPRPYLEKQAYMERVYVQAQKAGATKLQMRRLHKIAYRESRGNPRLCVPGGCGPFQNEVHSLIPRHLRSVYVARAFVRFLLTNKPGFAATTALDLLHRCELLSKEHWSCCYGGAWRPECRIKWDENYRDRQNQT